MSRATRFTQETDPPAGCDFSFIVKARESTYRVAHQSRTFAFSFEMLDGEIPWSMELKTLITARLQAGIECGEFIDEYATSENPI